VPLVAHRSPFPAQPLVPGKQLSRSALGAVKPDRRTD
jgi:hypothetical protein